jgi:sortase (surface protein transpeptidase)
MKSYTCGKTSLDVILYICILSHIAISLPQLQAGKTTTKNRHTQETKGTNEHDKKEKKKKSNLLENKY